MLEVDCHFVPDNPHGADKPPFSALSLGQGWRAVQEPEFRPGVVQIGWRPDSLGVVAVLWDDEVYSDSSRDNQRTWELGDTFEMFLAAEDRDDYVELHLTPNGHLFCAKFPDADTIKRVRQTNELGPLLLNNRPFEGVARLVLDPPGWIANAIIPAKLVTGSDSIVPGERWLFSFCRYDASRNREPVLSSTSPYSEQDFHRKQEWGRLTFVC